MPLIKALKIKKYYGDRLILDIDKFEVNEGEKIGLVGVNGAGKTTLIKTLIGEEAVYEGSVFLTESYSYISQGNDIKSSGSRGREDTPLDKRKEHILDREERDLTILSSLDESESHLSGGERVKLKIKRALDENKSLIIADEPTANLDEKGIRLLEKMFKEYNGAILLVSHDRDFLDSICSKIVEIDNGKMNIYKGNYTNFLALKEKELKRNQLEHKKYIDEKRRLEEAIEKKISLKERNKKPPKRMGNSEARLHKMGGQGQKKRQDKSINAIKTRIEQLDVPEKLQRSLETKITIQENMIIESKNLIEVKDFSLKLGEKVILENSKFKIKRGKKVALIGDNGSGKSSLLKEIIKGESKNIRLSNKLVIGYFDQFQDILDGDKTVLENIKRDSSYNETFIRTNLYRFGFTSDSMVKKVELLSGGEKVKLALCKTILSDNNILILDEPTNFLDIKAIESLEKALINTDKTLLIVCHDRKFVSNVCDYVLEIKNKNIVEFNGGYEEYKAEINKPKVEKEDKDRLAKIFILENELSKVISLLSIEKCDEVKEELNTKYISLIESLKKLKSEA